MKFDAPPYFYEIYGTTLESEIPFPELGPVQIDGKNRQNKISFRINNFDQSSFVEKESLPGFTYWFGPDLRTIVVDSPSLGQFRLCPQERVIDWKRSNPCSIDFARTVLKGNVLSLLLSHLPSLLILHGNVLALDGKGIVLCGPRQEGKSTFTAALLNEGFSLLSDDIVVIEKTKNAFVVRPGAPEIRLWPQSVSLLKSLPIRGRLLYPRTQKERFLIDSKNTWRFTRKVVPLKAIYLLTRRKTGRILIQDLKGREGLMAFLKNIYWGVIRDPKTRERQFEIGSELFDKIPIKRLTYPSGFNHFLPLKRALMKDLKGRSGVGVARSQRGE